MISPQGETIGWVVMDTNNEDDSNTERIICAAIAFSKKAPKDLFTPLIKGYDYENEEIVDFLALRLVVEEPKLYERAGRERVVKKGWLQTCSKEHFVVK